jgi:hypothetical protein
LLTVKEIGHATFTFGLCVVACSVALTPPALALTTPGAVLVPVTPVLALVVALVDVLVLLDVEEPVEELVLGLLDPPQALSSAAASSAISVAQIGREGRMSDLRLDGSGPRSVCCGGLPAFMSFVHLPCDVEVIATGGANLAAAAPAQLPIVLDVSL